jgi:four helix bundle protein
MRDFRKLDIWSRGISVVKDVYTLTETLPQTEKFGLISQMQRCAVSIPSNIAEGCSRNSEIEFKRFLEMAIGSSFELETQLILCIEIGFIERENLESLLSDLHLLQKQINSLISKIVNNQRPTAKSQ